MLTKLCLVALFLVVTAFCAPLDENVNVAPSKAAYHKAKAQVAVKKAHLRAKEVHYDAIRKAAENVNNTLVKAENDLEKAQYEWEQAVLISQVKEQELEALRNKVLYFDANAEAEREAKVNAAIAAKAANPDVIIVPTANPHYRLTSTTTASRTSTAAPRTSTTVAGTMKIVQIEPQGKAAYDKATLAQKQAELRAKAVHYNTSRKAAENVQNILTKAQKEFEAAKYDLEQAVLIQAKEQELEDLKKKIADLETSAKAAREAKVNAVTAAKATNADAAELEDLKKKMADLDASVKAAREAKAAAASAAEKKSADMDANEKAARDAKAAAATAAEAAKADAAELEDLKKKIAELEASAKAAREAKVNAANAAKAVNADGTTVLTVNAEPSTNGTAVISTGAGTLIADGNSPAVATLNVPGAQ